MCYAKPGPRCASHLTTDIQKLETEIKDLESAPGDVSKFKLVQVRSRLDAYRFAFDGTQTGQTQLQAALDSMDTSDPDYRDIKKYKENARKEYDLKIRNFKEFEKLREEREAKKNDLLSRKAQLEAELAALDASADDFDPDNIADNTPTTPTGGTSSYSYGGKGGYSTGKGGSVSSPAYRNPRSSPARGSSTGSPIGRTTAHAYAGKGFGGK